MTPGGNPPDTPDMLADDALVAVYNEELVALSGQAAVPQRLEKPDATAHAVSPICGSEVTVDLALDETGKVAGFGFEVEACALTRAVVAVMKQAILGQARADVARAGGEVAAMLAGKPVVPSGAWEKLILLAPVKDYTARHNSILLPFEAVDRAFGSLEK